MRQSAHAHCKTPVDRQADTRPALSARTTQLLCWWSVAAAHDETGPGRCLTRDIVSLISDVGLALGYVGACPQGLIAVKICRRKAASPVSQPAHGRPRQSEKKKGPDDLHGTQAELD